MRWIKLGLIVVAVALLVPIGMVFAYLAVMDTIGDNRARAFYEKHKLLREMRDAARRADPRPLDPGAIRRAVFLEIIPLGTTQPETIRALASEGFVCKRWDSPRSKHAVDCYVSNNPDYIQRWLIQIDFDDEERLSNVKVIVLKSPMFSY